MADTPTQSLADHRDEAGSQLLVTQGTAVTWQHAGWPTVRENWAHAFVTHELTAVPGVRELGYDSQAEAALGMRQDVEGLLASLAAHRGNLAAELRYLASPNDGQPTRVRLFLTVRAQASNPGDAATAATAAAASVASAVPSSFTWTAVHPTAADPPPAAGSWIVEVRREESVALPQVARDSDYFYMPYPISGDGSGWPRFLAALAAARDPVWVSLLFTPTVLDPDERTAVDHVLTGLRFHASPRVEHDAFGNPVNVAADGAAAEALTVWERWAAGTDRSFLVRASVIGEKGIARQIANALGGAVSTVRPGSGERRWPVATQSPHLERDLLTAHAGLEWRTVAPWGGNDLWQREDAPHVLRRIPYLLSTTDAASLAILPVPDDQGAEGFPRARRAAARRTALLSEDQVEGEGVRLGHLLHEGQAGPPASLPLSALNRHVLVVGAPGSGKTTSVHTLLYSLWRDHSIPWLAIEPVKTEYRSLIKAPGMDALRIFTLGQEDVAPLRLNPLAPPPGVPREEHMSAVMASFTAALPLDPPLPSLLEEAIDRTYENAGWDYDTTAEDGVAPPTLRAVIPAYEDVVRSHGYSQEIRDNLTAAISARLTTMMRGARGRLLDTMESVDWEPLMQVPVVIELDSIRNPEEKAVLAAFVLDRVRAAAKHRGSTSGELRHVTVFEEAHQLLARIEGPAESARATAIRAFCDDIAELRALGEGFVVSDQRPSALADAAVANTGTRILHRLESAADRNIVLADLDVGETDAQAAARLTRGEALLRWPDREEAEFVKIEPPAQIDTGAPVSKEQVREWARDQTAAVHKLRPYPLCAGKTWSNVCEPATRALGEKAARTARDEAQEIWRQADGKPEALDPLAKLLLRETRGDAHAAYCAAVHLSVTTKVLRVRSANIAPRLVKAIEAHAGETTEAEESGW